MCEQWIIGHTCGCKIHQPVEWCEIHFATPKEVCLSFTTVIDYLEQPCSHCRATQAKMKRDCARALDFLGEVEKEIEKLESKRREGRDHDAGMK